MSQPGWYPDPAGTPGRFRYWDGATWSDQTTADPAHTSAPSAPGPAPSSGRRGRGRGPLVAAIAAVVVVALALWWFLGRSGNQASAPEDTNTAAPTVSSWNEKSTTPSASASDDNQPSSAEMVSCPMSTGQTLEHPSDGRLHGGHLSVASLGDTWVTDDSTGPNWTIDTHGEVKQIVPGWVSSNQVGALVKADGFTAPKQAAYAFMSCYASSSYYQGFTGRTDVTSQAVTIDGKQGWWLRSQVRVVFATDPSITGDLVDIIVVDTGDQSLLSFWEGNATINDSSVQAEVDKARGTLKVDS